jgi:4-amino-4-deoxy-L-arabinose transferase-like glycosyltransferase
MDIGQGAGLSGASGVRPFLPALLAGALARENSGVDFSGTDFSFLESPVFLLAVFVLAVGSYALQRRGQSAPEAAMLVLGLVLGALLFAGSLADGHHESWPGIIGGIACAALGYYALAALFARARRRVAGSTGAVALLGVYADGIALALAGLSILFPPVAYAALVVFLVLIIRSRSESAQKYEGLRSLR